jgi:hypothetical protein
MYLPAFCDWYVGDKMSTMDVRSRVGCKAVVQGRDRLQGPEPAHMICGPVDGGCRTVNTIHTD